MNIDQFKSLGIPSPRFRIRGADIDGSLDDRTLLYGTARNSGPASDAVFHHVYLQSGEIYSFKYCEKYKIPPVSGGATGLTVAQQILPPDAKYFPEFCDLEFCKFLIENRLIPEFYPFGTSLHENLPIFHGKSRNFWISIDVNRDGSISMIVAHRNKFGAMQRALGQALALGEFGKQPRPEDGSEIDSEYFSQSRDRLESHWRYDYRRTISRPDHELSSTQIRELPVPAEIEEILAPGNHYRDPKDFWISIGMNKDHDVRSLDLSRSMDAIANNIARDFFTPEEDSREEMPAQSKIRGQIMESGGVYEIGELKFRIEKISL